MKENLKNQKLVKENLTCYHYENHPTNFPLYFVNESRAECIGPHCSNDIDVAIGDHVQRHNQTEYEQEDYVWSGVERLSFPVNWTAIEKKEIRDVLKHLVKQKNHKRRQYAICHLC